MLPSRMRSTSARFLTLLIALPTRWVLRFHRRKTSQGEQADSWRKGIFDLSGGEGDAFGTTYPQLQYSCRRPRPSPAHWEHYPEAATGYVPLPTPADQSALATINRALRGAGFCS